MCLNFLKRHNCWFYLFLCTLMIGQGVWRISQTYPVLSQTADEATHLAAGLAWWQFGTYDLEPLHPPLARIFMAALPYAAGARLEADAAHAKGCDQADCLAPLRDETTYWPTLTRARMGILPFFIIAAVIVAVWSRQLYGGAAGIIATACFTTMPPVLAHSGLATTDAAVMAGVLAAAYGMHRLLPLTTWKSAVGLALVTAAALLTKHSAVVWLACAGCVTLGMAWRAGQGIVVWRSLLHYQRLMIWVVLLGIWAAYHFSMLSFNGAQGYAIQRPVAEERLLQEAPPSVTAIPSAIPPASGWFVETPLLPGFQYFIGLTQAVKKNADGHAAYVLGERLVDRGVWYFFPVALAVKTPLATLLLGLMAVMCAVARQFVHGRQLFSLFMAATMLLAVMPSNVNIGVRHVLPMMPFLAMAAGLGAWWLLQRARVMGAGILLFLVCWQTWESARATPDFLAYFNPIAHSAPEHFLIDSDLDWGQDLARLSTEFTRRNITQASVYYAGNADFRVFFPEGITRRFPPEQATGWIAVSLNYTHVLYPTMLAWLTRHKPVATVGNSILLYYVPPL